MRVSAELLASMAEKRVLRLSRMLHIEIQSLYPKRAKILGEKNLLAFCERCALDAHRLGCKNYGELKAYAFIAMHLGVGYTSDPQYPWIRDILNKDETFNLKMEALIKIFFKDYYLSKEEDLTQYNKALSKLTELNSEEIIKLRKYSEIADVLKEIYPERVALLGGTEQLSNALAISTHEKIKVYGLEHPMGVFIVSTLVFFLGADVDKDPMYPWVEKYLNSKEPNRSVKIDKLVKVIQKRIKNNSRNIDKILEERVA